MARSPEVEGMLPKGRNRYTDNHGNATRGVIPKLMIAETGFSAGVWFQLDSVKARGRNGFFIQNRTGGVIYIWTNNTLAATEGLAVESGSSIELGLSDAVDVYVNPASASGGIYGFQYV